MIDKFFFSHKGYGLIGRLCFIIDNSEELRLEGTQLLLQHLKQTSNTNLYKKIFREAKARGNSQCLGELDSEWIAKTDAKALEQQHMKEEELKSVSLRHIKEAARLVPCFFVLFCFVFILFFCVFYTLLFYFLFFSHYLQ